MELNLIDLTLEIRTSSKAALSQRLLFAGEEFAETCRTMACRFPTRQCAQCSSRASCDWQFIFGQQLSHDPDALRRHQKPPLPFIFSIPMPDILDDREGVLECGLVIVGRAICCLDMLLSGFNVLLAAEHGSLCNSLLLTASRDYQGALYPLANPASLSPSENLVIMSAENILISCPWECTNLRIRLVSPLRLVARGRQLYRFDFSTFACSIMRRVTSLAYYYCGYEFDCDFKELSNLTRTVICRGDFFTAATGGRRKTAGISGSGCFSGDFGGLLPFLMLGSYFHTGKNASSGMGAFELDIT
ncbi:MAG: CRISPR system precrRNA processing endoribonuclease RAMP protein Cas6 [Desulfuromonadales bacterium]|nr:CRISPR system precrRNA processing endoribonuclease RAMP protein Cas6 [Desulfuromonadales bacterium]